jgi:hypothetical protein
MTEVYHGRYEPQEVSSGEPPPYQEYTRPNLQQPRAVIRQPEAAYEMQAFRPPVDTNNINTGGTITYFNTEINVYNDPLNIRNNQAIIRNQNPAENKWTGCCCMGIGCVLCCAGGIAAVATNNALVAISMVGGLPPLFYGALKRWC